MNDKIETLFVSFCSVYLMNMLRIFREYAPDVIIFSQVLIGILTVIYLLIKIKKHKSQ